MTARANDLERLPLFADDAAIGAALLGRERAHEWPAMARQLEARGFPTIDPVIGLRYVPAVLAFFDFRYGLRSKPPATPDWDQIETLVPIADFAATPAVYFVGAGGFVKIGYSANWMQRIAELQTGCPFKLSLLYLMHGTRQIEHTIHQQFADLRLHGEWFRGAPTLIHFLERYRAEG